jgi:hypothetical protein
MQGNHLFQAAESLNLINAASAANTAAATSAWVDVRKYEGDLLFEVITGAITGTCTLSVEDATDGSGTGGAAIATNEAAPAAISTANQNRKFTVNAGATRGFVRLVGTVVTGPVVIAAALLAHPKYSS